MSHGNIPPSELLSSSAYWHNPTPVEWLPRDDMHSAAVAEYIGGAVLNTRHFRAVEVPFGEFLPLSVRSQQRILQLVIDGRVSLPLRSGEPQLLLGESLEEFNDAAGGLWNAVPGALTATTRLVQTVAYYEQELSRTLVYGCEGFVAPYAYACRTADSLLDAAHDLPQAILPWVRVGEPLRLPPLAQDMTREVQVARAFILTPIRAT